MARNPPLIGGEHKGEGVKNHIYANYDNIFIDQFLSEKSEIDGTPNTLDMVF